MLRSALYTRHPKRRLSPRWENVQLLCHFDNGNGSTTFTDSSSFARALSASGSITQSTAVPIAGDSVLLCGSTKLLTTADTAALRHATGDFIQDFWCYFPSLQGSTYGQFLGKRTGTGSTPCGVGIDNTNIYIEGWNSSSVKTIDLTMPAAWIPTGIPRRITVSRCGEFIHGFVNGRLLVSQALPSSTTLYSSASDTYCIGNISSAIRPINGYMDEVMIVTGEGIGEDFDPFPMQRPNT